MQSFVFETDAIPETWQFLNGLRRDDLISELLQNELDAGSSITNIRFEKDRLICEGNGTPIDKDGWTRLRLFRGAGDKAPRKRLKTGVKNHGLKACFTIGDNIFIRSAGKYTQQTLYSPEFGPGPYPGAMPNPEIDSTAPKVGCRIEVPYRNRDLRVDVGERLTFAALNSDDIDTLFKTACRELPQRFLGVVRPGLRPRYTVVVDHWKHGTRRFVFTARTRSNSAHGLFSRTCRVDAGDSNILQTVQEQAYLIRMPKRLAGTHEIPEFYHRRGGFFAEVSWAVNAKEKPTYVPGQLRYPIAYVGRDAWAATGIGVSFSAPFVSDAERHGISDQDEVNRDIIQHCDEAIIKILRDDLIPQHGPAALTLVCDDQIEDQERRRRLVQLLLKHRAIPIVGKPRRGRKVRLVQDSPGKRGEWSFVIPSDSSDSSRVSNHLAAICPKEFRQLHPKTPRNLISILAENYHDLSLSNDEHCRFTVFNEFDVVSILKHDTDEGLDFPWNARWERSFSSVKRTKLLLGVLNERQSMGLLDDDDREQIQRVWKVPADGGSPSPLNELCCAREITDMPPGIDPPALIHRDLRDHRLLRRKDWKLPRFDLAQLLVDLDLSEHPAAVTREFWHWTAKNWRRFSAKHRRMFAVLPIWPTVNGRHVKLSEMCYPKRPAARRILRSTLHIPTARVLNLPAVEASDRGILSIRTRLSIEDLRSWFDHRIGHFEVGQKLTKSEKGEFRRFENETALLARDHRVAELLREFQSEVPGVDKTGVLRLCSNLHRSTRSIRALHLRRVDLIQRPKHELDAVFAPRTTPSASAIRRAMEHRPKDKSAWLKRIAAYVDAAEREGSSPDIDDLRCIWAAGRWYKPVDLALKGNIGDYWGTWKRTLNPSGRSVNEIQALVGVGVLRGQPTSESSREFFEWIQSSPIVNVVELIPQIVRHFGHSNGVMSWIEHFPHIPCLPVVENGILRLVSLVQAKSPMNRVCIDDFPELSSRIRNSELTIGFVVDTVRGTSVSVVSHIQECGVNRLSQVAGEPIRVSPSGDNTSDDELRDTLKFLQSGGFRKELKSRLAQWEIPVRYLRSDWFAQVRSVRRLAVCQELFATFKVWGSQYDVPTISQYDGESETLYLVEGRRDKLAAFFNAISDLVFTEDAPRMANAALEKAVLMELPRLDQLNQFQTENDDDGDYIEDELENVLSEGLTEPRATHSSGKDGQDQNSPQPSALSDKRGARRTAKAKRKSKSGSASKNARLPSQVEEEDIQRLRKTYAWHCQACLAKGTPSQLAPNGSYASSVKHRRSFMEAHHPDQVHVGGARHGGNLLLLCKRHHDALGDIVTRDQITAALRTNTQKHTVEYDTGSENCSKLDGVLVDVKIPTSGKTLSLFFAKAHRKYWMKRS